MMYLKVYEIGGEKLLAVCDKWLIGKSFEEGEYILHVSEQFYKGEIATEEEVRSALMDATNINLVGEKAVRCAIDAGILREEGIIWIGGVPHAQIFVI